MTRSSTVAAAFDVGNAALRTFLQDRNRTDEEQRHHASIIKDLAPASPGLEIAF